MSESRSIKWEKGEFAEGMDWELQSNATVGYDGNKCPHCTPNPKYKKGSYNNNESDQWIIPWVIICKNEAGHNSTWLCLGCLVDAARSDLDCYNYLTYITN